MSLDGGGTSYSSDIILLDGPSALVPVRQDPNVSNPNPPHPAVPTRHRPVSAAPVRVVSNTIRVLVLLESKRELSRTRVTVLLLTPYCWTRGGMAVTTRCATVTSIEHTLIPTDFLTHPLASGQMETSATLSAGEKAQTSVYPTSARAPPTKVGWPAGWTRCVMHRWEMRSER